MLLGHVEQVLNAAQRTEYARRLEWHIDRPRLFAVYHLFQSIDIANGEEVLRRVRFRAFDGLHDILNRLSFTLRTADLSFLITLGAQYLSLLVTFGALDFGLALPFGRKNLSRLAAFGFEDRGALGALGAHPSPSRRECRAAG